MMWEDSKKGRCPRRYNKQIFTSNVIIKLTFLFVFDGLYKIVWILVVKSLCLYFYFFEYWNKCSCFEFFSMKNNIMTF